LSIARRVADLLNHKLDVHSRAGKGSVFSVEVPVGVISEANTSDSQPHREDSVPGGGLILVIDDDDAVLNATR
jgi:hypothetical protein